MKIKILPAFAATVLALSFSASITGQTPVSDTDKIEILRAVLTQQLEMKQFEFPQRLLLSTQGIEPLEADMIAFDPRVTVINREELDKKLLNTSLEYVVVRIIRESPTGFTVMLSNVTEERRSCFGPSERCQETVLYDVRRLPQEWEAKLMQQRGVILDLFERDCKSTALIY